LAVLGLLCFLVDVYTSGWLATPITMTYRNWLVTSEVHKRRIHSAELPVAQYDTRWCFNVRPKADILGLSLVRLWAWSSSPLIFIQNTRCSTHTYRSRRQKFCCRRTARVEQFTGYYQTDHQLRTVQATSENTFIQGLEIAAHCDSWLLCAIHRVKVTSFRSVSMPAGYRRHLVGKTQEMLVTLIALKYALLVS